MFFVSASPYDPSDLLGELDPEERARLEKDPVFGVITQTHAKRSSSPPGDGSSLAEKSFQEYLPELARLYHVSFLSDAYWGSARAGRDALPAEPTPLYALLARLVSLTHCWDRHGRLVRLRSRTWFRDRLCEVPLRLVRQWNELGSRDGALSLGTFAACAATLSDWQIDTLDSLVELAGLSKDFSIVPESRQGLRFYATLTSAQRQDLWLHQPVRLIHLTSAQRGLLAATLREGYWDPDWVIGPEWLADVSLTLEEEPLIRVRQHQGATVTEQDLRAGVPAPPPAGGPAVTAGSAKAVAIARYPVSRVVLSIHYAAGWKPLSSLTVAPP